MCITCSLFWVDFHPQDIWLWKTPLTGILELLAALSEGDNIGR